MREHPLHRRCKALFMEIPPFDKRPHWLKGRGYMHVTPKINIFNKYEEIYHKVTNKDFVAAHGFFPLIHSVIKERKYKKNPNNPAERAHSHVQKGKTKTSAKLRPLHYSTHIDAMIFAYYAQLLLDQYEEKLKQVSGLSECIIAYRKIAITDKDKGVDPVADDKGKGTVHFAKEAFAEISERAKDGCVVLMFDIENFFSGLDHDHLKKAWCDLFDVPRLNKAHFNVFKASTDFRYILRDDLRLRTDGKKRLGFDESRLSHIRSQFGLEAFFESVKSLRTAIDNKEVTVYKHPFVKPKKDETSGKVTNKIIGIPQGLPISAVLANLYLLEFDKDILKKVVAEMGGYYRRYSDDILIVCAKDKEAELKKFVVDAILKYELSINQKKTETYLFEQRKISTLKSRIVSVQLLEEKKEKVGKPLTYLGFEFYGTKTLIKSANLAKFYRRMILFTKRKAHRAIKLSERDTSIKKAVFMNQLKRKYTIRKLSQEKEPPKLKYLSRKEDGTFGYKFKPNKNKRQGNYLSYVKRASKIMNEPAINKQIRKHKHILHVAMNKHLKK